MLRLGTMVNKADRTLSFRSDPRCPSFKKLSLLPRLCQGSILGFYSPLGFPTVTTLGCHCVETVSPIPQLSRMRHSAPLAPISGPGCPVCPVPGFLEDPELVLLSPRNAYTNPRPSVTSGVL